MPILMPPPQRASLGIRAHRYGCDHVLRGWPQWRSVNAIANVAAVNEGSLGPARRRPVVHDVSSYFQTVGLPTKVSCRPLDARPCPTRICPTWERTVRDAASGWFRRLRPRAHTHHALAHVASRNALIRHLRHIQGLSVDCAEVPVCWCRWKARRVSPMRVHHAILRRRCA